MKRTSRRLNRRSTHALRDTVLLWGVRIGGLMDDTLRVKVVLETVAAKLRSTVRSHDFRRIAGNVFNKGDEVNEVLLGF